MNCQEVPEPNALCQCCEDALQVRNQLFFKNKALSDRRSSKDCKSPSASYAHAQHGRSENRCQHQEVSENGCDPVDKRNYMKHSASCHKAAGHQNQSPFVDRNTMQTLNNLRQRACRLIEASDASGFSEEEDFRPCTSQREKCTEESAVRRRVQNLNYDPQSEFLKKMKRQSGEGNTTSTQCEEGGQYRQDDTCKCWKCRCDAPDAAINLERSVYEVNYQKPNMKSTPYSDMSSIHDPTRCFRAWRSKPTDTYQADGSATLRDQITFKEHRGWIQPMRSDGDTLECEEAGGAKRNKGGHISRSTRRKRRSCRKKKKSRSLTTECDSPHEFEPSLKRPHPNSCDRCWRYASPARSPVNKPSQRFDPNYRRSHSLMNIKSGDENEGGSSQRECNCDRVVQFDKNSKLMKPSKSVPRARSADNIKKVITGKCEHVKRQDDKTPKSKDIRVKSASKKDAQDHAVSPSAKVKPKSERKPKVCHCTNKQSNERGQHKLSSPMVCSPSMFDKSNRNLNSGRMFTISSPEPTTLGEEAKKFTKDGPVSSYATEKAADSVGGSRARSNDRELRPCDRSCITALRQDFCRAFQTIRSCCCPGSHHNESIRGHQTVSQGGPSPEHMTRTNIHTNGHKARKENCLDSSPREYGNENQGDQSFYMNRRSKDWLERTGENREKRGKNPTSPCNCDHCLAYRNDNTNGFWKMRCKAEAMQASGSDSHGGTPITLWNRDYSRDDGTKKQSAMPSRKWEHHSLLENRKVMRDSNPESLSPSNPRKYCVFYMTKSKDNKDDEVEVLIEELTQGRNGKSGKGVSLREKMKKMTQNQSDSMALRFQKGMANKCMRSESNRVLYF